MTVLVGVEWVCVGACWCVFVACVVGCLSMCRGMCVCVCVCGLVRVDASLLGCVCVIVRAFVCVY